MSLTAEERLIQVLVKVKRAKKHLSELEISAERYRDEHVRYVDEPRLGFSQGEPDVKNLPVIEFEMLAIAGDVLHNLRSALDHIVYQLALVANPAVSEETLRKVAFPIGKSLDDYKSLRSRATLLKAIEPRAAQFIDSLRPYKGGSESLWRLHEMNNIDKHCRLLGVDTEIMCEIRDGHTIKGYYLLKTDNPPFSTISVPEREVYKEPVSIQSLVQRRDDERKALIPTLQLLIAAVESYVERFASYLVKETE
jgi:hypothetical protein